MSTITQTLTLAQLREDLERLASAHPGSYPTNVIEVIHQCGEITVDAENDEDALREELQAQKAATASAEKDAMEATERADKAEEEITTLRAEMDALRDTSAEGETVLSYRQRAISAEEKTVTAYRHVREMRRALEESQRETKALRMRKGVTAGVFKCIHEIAPFLATVAQSSASIQHADKAAELLKEIQTT